MTTHKLPFEVAPWPHDADFLQFRVGTCHGVWRSTGVFSDILSICNERPGKGHFEDVLQWFSHSCRRDGKNLRILEVGNKAFFQHLINKRGFAPAGNNCIKNFTK